MTDLIVNLNSALTHMAIFANFGCTIMGFMIILKAILQRKNLSEVELHHMLTVGLLIMILGK